MQNPNIVHITRDWRGETLTLSQTGGLTVNVSAFKATQDAELRSALRFAHTVAMVAPETMMRLKREEVAQ